LYFVVADPQRSGLANASYNFLLPLKVVITGLDPVIHAFGAPIQ
jgi:hypothetical protein